jgi:tetratricopeptide (TPR) repeat protein
MPSGAELAKRILILVCLTFVVYSSSMGNSFVWDDVTLIEENVSVHYLKYIPSYFTHYFFPSRAAPVQGGQIHYWRPLTILSFAVDFSFWRNDPLGYHLTNFFIHTLNALLVMLIFYSLPKTRSIAFIASLIFALHPLQTNAVAYISGRTDLLAAFFFLLGCILFLRFITAQKPLPFILLGFSLCLALSLMAKEAILMAPFLLLVLGIFADRPDRSRLAASLLTAVAVLTAYVAYRSLAHLGMGDWRSAIGQVSARSLLAAAESVILYGRLFILPVDLHMERFLSLQPADIPAVFFAASVVLFALTAVIRAFSRRETWALLALWFFVALLPVSNLVPLYPGIAHEQIFLGEQLLYLPSVGLSALLAFFLRVSVSSAGGTRQTVRLLGIALLSLFGVLAYAHTNYWKDTFTFYEQTYRHYPGSLRMRLNLGMCYVERERYADAIEMILPTIEKNPRCATCHFALGRAYYGLGKIAEARREFLTSVECDPLLAIAHNNLGVIALKEGDTEKAIVHYTNAVNAAPLNPDMRTNLAFAYIRRGDTEKAVSTLREALSIDPRSFRALLLLAKTYAAQGRTEKAAAQYRLLWKYHPAYQRAHPGL